MNKRIIFVGLVLGAIIAAAMILNYISRMAHV